MLTWRRARQRKVLTTTARLLNLPPRKNNLKIESPTSDESTEGNGKAADAEEQLEAKDVVPQHVQLDLHDFCHSKDTNDSGAAEWGRHHETPAPRQC